jgi:response regulator RpfG family c-di-GMP phosphodiesterase
MAGESKHLILVVDDEPEILQSLNDLLRMEFQVRLAESGLEALHVMKHEPIQVVMTDQRMPQMTGVELLSQVQGGWPDAVRMVFTGYSDVKAVIDAVNEGHIFRYITKPWDPEELRAVLHQACDEYDRLVQHKRLLTEVRGYQSQCEALVSGLQTGALGTLNATGQAQAAQVAEAGQALRERLDTALE